MAQRVQNINTGEQKVVSTEEFKRSGQDLANKGYVPVAGGASANAKGISTNRITTTGSSGVGSGSGEGDVFDKAGDLLSDVQTPMSLKDIRAREAEQKERIRQQAVAIFDPMVDRAEEIGERRLGSAKGQVGISRGLGLSTAETSYLNNIESQTQERIDEIYKQRGEFISSGNFQAAEMANKSIMKLQEAQNNILFKKIDLGLQMASNERADKQLSFEERRVEIAEGAADLAYEKFGFDREAFAKSEARLNRTADIQELNYLRDVSKEEKEEALDNIARLASSGIGLDGMSEEEITVLETKAGLVPGSFEAIYSKAQRDAAIGEKIDSLKIKKMEADLQNVYSTIAKRNAVKPNAEGVFPGLNKDQSKALAPFLANVKTYESREDALANLEDDKTLIMLTTGGTGLQILEQEIDRLFPPVQSQVQDKADDIKSEPSLYTTGSGATGEILRKHSPTLIKALSTALPRLNLKAGQIASNLIAGLSGKKEWEISNEELNQVENLLKMN